MPELHLEDIDWNILWQQARKKKSWKSKGVDGWNRRAASFARQATRSVYTEKFLAMLQPQKTWSVLDIGCGPGTLALPLAGLVRRVTALDFSANMLALLKQQAQDQGIVNISTHKLAWEDDWQPQGITPHDLTIASRSLAVRDLRAALERLTSYARKAAVITDQVGSGPFDPAAFRAIGRQLRTGPDYIYTVNLLYQMGFQACVDFIRIEEKQPYASFAEALARFTWMFNDLTTHEEKRLKNYVRSIIATAADGTVFLHRDHVPTWAFIRWMPK